MKTISFIIPSHNNLMYLKTAYNSIRKHHGYIHDIVMLDDASEDGTWEWLKSIEQTDSNVQIYRNKGPKKLGHTILYDIGVDMCTNNIFSIFHADMICSPMYVENLLKHLKEKTVVSATRIEPPLHPAGKEKIVMDFGLWPDEIKESEFLSFCEKKREEFKGVTTKGIFAPWLMYKKDFQAIGGHDPLFAPFPYEDSDIFNRFILAGYDIIQSRDSFVYHLTCRGHRWTSGELGKNDDMYPTYERNARRNYLRKWGSWIQNDEYLKPIISPKYNIGFIIHNCNLQILEMLEPWCSTIYTDEMYSIGRYQDYIEMEQSNTLFNLQERIQPIENEKNNDILVEFNGSQLTNDGFQFLQQLPEILKDSGESGEMEYDIFKITINSLKTYEKDLVKCQK
ncbi:MAG: glycosyltransferase family 2 protein [Candidatus Pelagibacter sp.]|nr:glycosyltransferase family 2 protein [Candidatus Pelagibacter sp.]